MVADGGGEDELLKAWILMLFPECEIRILSTPTETLGDEQPDAGAVRESRGKAKRWRDILGGKRYAQDSH